ncbi:uncharacterized protein DFL_005218 [Arthrobotrys flagrans]|uniref:Uncharacterized protein n=1 Tax=Arthrobotrys flagrans TaxID=97331 RepID=A0A437A774_ARTFL|nr:hypothetical protein DFL_005218 [Arthrobotrys flagrans]
MPPDISSETAAKSNANRTPENQRQDVRPPVYHKTMVAYTPSPSIDNSAGYGLLGRNGNTESVDFEISQGIGVMGLDDQGAGIRGFETEPKDWANVLEELRTGHLKRVRMEQLLQTYGLKITTDALARKQIVSAEDDESDRYSEVSISDSALHRITHVIIVEGGHLEMAELLLQHSRERALKLSLSVSWYLHAIDYSNSLHAGQHNNLEMVALLLKHGMGLRSKTLKGYTALHIAARGRPWS